MKNLNKLFDLSNRTAMITGASGHLGKIICNTLAEMGANLILVDHPNSNKTKLLSQLKKYKNINVDPYNVDLKSNKERSIFIKKILEKYNKLNILINNAAYTGDSNLAGWNEDFENQRVEAWNEALSVNLTAPFHLCKSFKKIMKKSKGANVINIGSIYGTYSPDFKMYKNTKIKNPAAYGVSKSGLFMLTKWMSSEFGPSIRVNMISPGGIKRYQPSKFIDAYVNKTFLNRMANEKDIIGAICLFSSDASSHITGQNLIIDGGWGS